VGKKNKFILGDLVICKYDLEYLYYPYPSSQTPEQTRGPHFHTGIIIEIHENSYIIFDKTTLYEVLCTDGQRRRFTPWEVELLRSAGGSGSAR
tara:strand:+ start:8689 stop:8967 length:279 start_codon:yes stop_codon:yes gene_type:complete